jgi:hypothetical protein
MTTVLASLPPEELEPDDPPLDPEDVDDPEASEPDEVPPDEPPDEEDPLDPEDATPELEPEPEPESAAAPVEPPDPPMGPQATLVKRTAVRIPRANGRLLFATCSWSVSRRGPAHESTDLKEVVKFSSTRGGYRGGSFAVYVLAGKTTCTSQENRERKAPPFLDRREPHRSRVDGVRQGPGGWRGGSWRAFEPRGGRWVFERC